MKKILLTLATLLAASSSLATTIACQAGDPKSLGIQKVLSSQELKLSMGGAILLEQGNTKYRLAISDLYEEKKPSNVISKDALVLTTKVDGSVSQLIVSDGNTLMYLDENNSVGVFCRRTQ